MIRSQDFAEEHPLCDRFLSIFRSSLAFCALDCHKPDQGFFAVHIISLVAIPELFSDAGVAGSGGAGGA